MTDDRTIPSDLTDLLTTDRIGHVAWVRPDGSIATHIMWIDWDGEHVLTSSPMGSVKGEHARRNPNVSVSVTDDDPWRYVVVRGRVTEIRPDVGLEFINKMSERYTGGPYGRPGDREVFVITPDHVTSSRGGWFKRRR